MMDKLITAREAAEMIGIASPTLAHARCTGLGDYPPFVRIGGRAIRYRVSDIQRWIEERNTYRHTSAVAEKK